MSYTSRLINRLSSAVIGGKTHMEMWSEKHAQNYDSIRVFGCLAYYHVKNDKLSLWDSKVKLKVSNFRISKIKSL